MPFSLLLSWCAAFLCSRMICFMTATLRAMAPLPPCRGYLTATTMCNNLLTSFVLCYCSFVASVCCQPNPFVLLLLLAGVVQVRCDVLRDGKRLSMTVALGERGSSCE